MSSPGDSNDQQAPRRVVRGGSWSTYARDLRSTNRDADGADERRNDSGFRVVMKVLEKATATDLGAAEADAYGQYADLKIGLLVLRFRRIPAGSFQMGTNDCADWSCRNEGPSHRVTFEHDFWLAEHEITRALYREVMGEDPSHFADGDLQCPVESVSWMQAQEFCRRANSALRGVELTLPTEAQREYAGRAGTDTPFCTGPAITPAQANYNDYIGRPVPVKTYPPNAWGIFNAHGNVWEWTADEYHVSFAGAPNDGSAWVGGPDAQAKIGASRDAPSVLAQVQEQPGDDGVSYCVILRVDADPSRSVILGAVDSDQAYRIADAINEGAVRLLD